MALFALLGCGAEDAQSSAETTGDAGGGPADAANPADARTTADRPTAADARTTDLATPTDRRAMDLTDTGSAAVRFVGRVDRSDPAGPRFTWSGSEIVARFTGTSVAIRLRDSGNRFQVMLDGVALDTLVATVGQERYPLAANLTSGPHDLIVHRRTEAFVGETQLLGLELDSAGALLPPPPPAARRLEFVGDSITCGYGIDGTDMSCPFTPDTENHWETAGAIAARTLGAETITVAFSGKGIYRNFDGDMDETIPALYDRVLVDRPTPRWDFASWIPDAVIINLGTNDFRQGDPGPGFRDAYAAFVRRVRGNYPQARILVTLGPMLGPAEATKARDYLGAMMALVGDARVSYLEYPTQDPANGFGCDWHPSRATNRLMADRLTAELRSRLGW